MYHTSKFKRNIITFTNLFVYFILCILYVYAFLSYKTFLTKLFEIKCDNCKVTVDVYYNNDIV